MFGGEGILHFVAVSKDMFKRPLPAFKKKKKSEPGIKPAKLVR